MLIKTPFFIIIKIKSITFVNMFKNYVSHRVCSGIFFHLSLLQNFPCNQEHYIFLYKTVMMKFFQGETWVNMTHCWSYAFF